MFKYTNWSKVLKGILTLVFLILFFGFYIGSNSSPTSTSDNATGSTQKVSKEEKQALANKDVIDRLGHFNKTVDEVEKSEWYLPYSGNIPAETAIY